ncbi:MFS transporter, partial [Levilactobacillus parabrevis]
LRFLQGFFAGYIPNATALIAAETPRGKSGSALGILTTGYVSGNLIGPVLGGILAQVFSIRWTFILTGIFLIIVFILSATLVHEHFTPITRDQQEQSGSWLHRVKRPKLILVLLVSTMIIQMGNNSITPIISLYVKQLMNNVGPITLVAGIIAALPGISTLLAAPKLGDYGDRRGTSRVLIFGYVFAVLMYFPQGFVTSIWLLGILRFMIGVSDGALFPAVQTMLTKNSPQELTGTVFSWNQSFQAAGSMFGSLFGGLVANIFNYNGVFIFTAITLLLNFLLLWWVVPEVRHFRQKNA